MLKNKLRIYTTVWGSRYIDLFEKTILKSFSWDQNKKAILNEDYVWSVYTNAEDEEKIRSKMLKAGFTNLEFRRIQVPIIQTYDQHNQVVAGYKEEKIENNHQHMGLILLN